MKKFILLLSIIISLFGSVCAAEEEENIIEEYSSIYSKELTSAADEGELYEVFPEFDAKKIMQKSAAGQEIFDVREISQRVLELFFGEVKSVLKIMLYIIAVSLLSSYMTALCENERSEVFGVAYYACFIIVAGITSAAFIEIMSCARAAIDNILIVARLIVPVVIASLASSGAITSAEVFQPMLLGIIEVSLGIIESVFIPVFMLLMALNTVNSISDKINIDKTVGFLEKTIKWGLSILLTVFVGTAGLQSLASGAADSLSIKLTKYAASNLIPVVGGILSESVETVVNCSIIIKNAVGIVGIIVLTGTMLLPLLKIFACLTVLRLTAAIIQPVSDKKIVKCVSGAADCVGMVFATVAAVTVMLVIILTIMLNAGNTAAMLGR